MSALSVLQQMNYKLLCDKIRIGSLFSPEFKRTQPQNEEKLVIQNNTISILFVSLTLLLLGACTTIPVDERNQIRDEVDQTAETTIEQLVAKDPDIQAALDNAVGYAVASVSATKIPLVGGGYGLALLHDLEKNTRTYINVTRLDLGAGVGTGRAGGGRRCAGAGYLLRRRRQSRPFE